MKIYITSKKICYEINLIPLITNISYRKKDDFTISYSVDVILKRDIYKLPFKIEFDYQEVRIIDPETFDIVGYRKTYIKKRYLNFDLKEFIKKNESNKCLPVLIECLKLIFTYKNFNKTDMVDDFSEAIKPNQFFFKKDDLLCNNLDVLYQIDAKVLNKAPTCLDYSPIDCNLVSVNKPIFKGTIVECEELLFNDEKLAIFIKQHLQKIEKQNARHSEIDRREAERDTFFALTDGQLGSFDDFTGTLDDVETWSRG